MIDTAKIREIAERCLERGDMFVVEVVCSPASEIEVVIDSDESVSIDACVELSRRIEAELDREAEDFELTVASAGIGRPLKLLRQYRKLIGRPVEVVLKSGEKIVATLANANEESITLSYSQREAVPGSKKKQTVDVMRGIPLNEIKSTVEYLDFK